MKKNIEDILREMFGFVGDKKEIPKPTPTPTPVSFAKPDVKNPTYKKIKNALEGMYDFQVLKRFQKKYLIPFVTKSIALFNDSAHGILIDNYTSKSPTKDVLCQTIAYLYAEKDIFIAFLNTLPKQFQKAFYIIIERGLITDGEFLKECAYDVILPVDISKQYGYYSYDVDPKKEVDDEVAVLFQHSYVSKSMAVHNRQKSDVYVPFYSHSFSYSSDLLTVLRGYFPRPESIEIKPVTLPEKTTIFQGEDNLFAILNYAITYMEQGKLELTKTGKASTAQITKMQKFLSIPEFFPAFIDKDVATLRTDIFANWLGMFILKDLPNAIVDKNILQLSFLDMIKKMWDSYQKMMYHTNQLLWHINGTNSKYNLNVKYQTALAGFLNNLIEGEWIDVENLWALSNYDFVLPDPISMQDLQHMYINSTMGRINLGTSNNATMVKKPIFYANMFVFASIGLVDLAYDLPPDNAWAIQNALPTKYLTPYSGLKAVRLSALGAFLLGKTKEYVVQEVADENVQLDETTLYIFYNGKNQALRSVIQETARTAGTNLYKVDYESVLGDCSNYKQVQSKINIFQKLLSNNPPKIWKDFFENLQQKSYELKDENNMFRVFRLPQNPELINLIAREASLKKYILKAESFMVLIRRQDVVHVKKQLKNYGFLVDFLEN